MNKKRLPLVLIGFFYLSETNCIWPWPTKNKVDETKKTIRDCSISGLGDRYPNSLCYVFHRFQAQIQIVAARNNLEKVQSETLDESTIMAEKEAVRRIEEKYPECFDQKTGMLEIEDVNAIILYGPKGSGKTTVVLKLAELNESKLIEANGTSIINKYRGQGPKAIRDAFDAAWQAVGEGSQSVIVFIDEVDAFASNTSGDDKKEDLTTTQELWIQISKIKNEPRIACILATNKPKELHMNLLDRFECENQIEIAAPDKDKRKALFKLFFEKRLGAGALEKIKTNKSYFSSKTNEEYILDILVEKTEEKGIRFIKNYVAGLIRYCKSYNNGIVDFESITSYLESRLAKDKELETAENTKVAMQTCKDIAQGVVTHTASQTLSTGITTGIKYYFKGSNK